MRVSLIVSALFATSLIGGVALADRPGDDGGGRTSAPRMHDVRMHEVREAREARPRDDVRVMREAPVRERLREHGDMVDRSGSRTTVSKGQKDARNDVSRAVKDKPANEKQQAARNCSPTDDTCGGGRSQRKTDEQKARDKVAAEKAKQDRDDVQKMREKIRAEKLKAIIEKMMCEKHGNTCADNL